MTLDLSNAIKINFGTSQPFRKNTKVVTISSEYMVIYFSKNKKNIAILKSTVKNIQF